MATCDRRDDVAVLLLGACSPDEALEIERHVLGCDVCARHRRELGIVRSLLDVAADVPPLDTPPSDLREDVVARMVASRRRGRDAAMLLLGAAASLVLILGSALAWRSIVRDEGGPDIELVGATAAPDAWAEVNLHDRVEGTIIDVEAGDLPTDDARYEARVVGRADGVLASQPFTVSPDGWAQVLLATERALVPGDRIEVVRVDGEREVPVLRCDGECIA